METTNLWERLHGPVYEIDSSSDDDASQRGEDSRSQDYHIEEPVKLTIVGLMVTVEFQKCKYISETLYRCYPERFEKPIIKALLNLEWNNFLKDERRLKGGALWNIQRGVAVYYNSNFIGDDIALCKYVSTRYILPIKDFYRMGREALKDYFRDLMSTGRRCIYFMISIDHLIVGTMVFMLYTDIVPKTCELFLKRCLNLKRGYSDTPIHRIVPSSWIQCGGHRLTEVRLACENFAVSHDNRGVLSMCSSGRHNKNTTQFLVTLEKCTWMDTHYVAFGQMVHGEYVLSKIEEVPTKSQSPIQPVRIVRAGEFTLSFPKLGEDKLEQDLYRYLEEREATEYKNYYTRNDLTIEKEHEKPSKKGKQREFLDTDLRSYRPLDMLPQNIEEAFNYWPGQKSSCFFEVENCMKCGCSHDVGKCIIHPSSMASSDDDY